MSLVTSAAVVALATVAALLGVGLVKTGGPRARACGWGLATGGLLLLVALLYVMWPQRAVAFLTLAIGLILPWIVPVFYALS